MYLVEHFEQELHVYVSLTLCLYTLPKMANAKVTVSTVLLVLEVSANGLPFNFRRLGLSDPTKPLGATVGSYRLLEEEVVGSYDAAFWRLYHSLIR